MTTPDLTATERLAALERRITELEDERAIRYLINEYGYLSDFGSADEFTEIFTPDGALDIAMGASYGEHAATERWEGTAELHDFLADPEGRWDKSWYGNVMHMQGNNLTIEISAGDAIASGYVFTIISRDKSLQIIGASVNRWHLRKAEGKWLIRERKLRPIAHDQFAAMVLGEGRTRADDRG